MLYNYIKIAIRKALKDRIYTIINISGLAIGLAAFLFISGYVSFERDVDQFHEHYANIYRLHTDLKWNEMDDIFPHTAPAVGTAIVENFAEAAEVTRIRPYYGEQLVKIEDQIYQEDRIMAVDSNFLDVFSFEIIKGNPDKLFNQPNQAVLPQSFAYKYFGEKDPINQLIEINDINYKIVGIIEDARQDSHIDYSLLVSIPTDENVRYFEWSWVWCNLVTYVRLNEHSNPLAVEAKFPELVRNNAGYAIERLTGKSIDAFFDKGNHIDYQLEPLSEVYYSGYNVLGKSGSETFIYIFSIVAFTILLLACINYTNLTTARSLKRAKEIGLRKVVGTTRNQLYAQFLLESILFSTVAMAIAVIAYEAFNQVITNSFSIDWNLSLLENTHFLGYVVLLSLIVGIFSGLYPALYLSSFKPSRALKGLELKGQTKSPVRNWLVVFQFIISFCIIIFTFTVDSQIRYLRNQDLGFDKENLLVINNINYLTSRNAFKEEINRNAAVVSSTLSSAVPSQNGRGELFRKLDGEEEDFIMSLIDADQDFIATFGLTINNGNNYRAEDLQTENPKAVINERAREIMQFDEAIGKQIVGLDDGRPLEVSGVIKDFDYYLSQVEYRPIIIRPYAESNPENAINYLTVKIASSDLPATIAAFEEIWQKQETGLPFHYSFYDQIFNDMYNKEIRLGNLLFVFSILAILIASLGLVGLISFHTEQMTKSIGIRKVFGASSLHILTLITKDFVKLFIIAFVIAIPIANYALEDWLETFVNQMDISFWLFLIPGMTVMFIALFTIWLQSFKSATANPVDAIRNE